MILLSIFYFFSSLTLVVNSVCTRDKPRKEGFLRSICVPGYYSGSCLIILEKSTLHNAIETCKYDYGGRLATAPTKDAIQIWIRTIYFNTKYTFDNDTKFWIGYGKNHQNELGFVYEKPNEIMENYIGKSIWNRVFGEPEKSAPIQWENNANENLLDLSNCPNHGSFIATAQNDEELDMIRNIIVPYNLPDEIFVGEKGFWVGLKSFGRITFSMDGTKPIFGADANPGDRLCAAAANKNFCLPGEACEQLSQLSLGLVKPCYDTSNSYLEYNPLPYMCQKFADSSKVKNI
uniref:C-type lectin domain-containing protein n=1 Tax=Panagrolaimus davidi TaxID=227884 RepID=A0A914PNH4_9BILA